MAKEAKGGGGGGRSKDAASNSGPSTAITQKAAPAAKAPKSRTGVGPGLNRDQIEALVTRMIDSAKAIQAADFRAFEARVESQLRQIDILKHYPTTGKMIAIALSGFVLTIGAVLAVLAFGGDRFDGGIGYGTFAGDKFSQATIAIDRNAQRDDELRRNVEQLVKKMDSLIDADSRKK